MKDVASLSDAVQTYFEALHEGDTSKLKEVFLPEANLYAVVDNELKCLPISDYIELVAGRASPASQGHEPSGELVSLDFSGPTSAIAKVKVAVPPTQFVDFLNFLKIDGRWRIVTKVYHIAS